MGVSAALGGLGWILLAIAASDFRRSFGASEVGAIRLVALPIALVFVIVTVVLPGNRTLLHVAAAVLLVALVGSALILRESVFVGSVGVLFFGAWFFFYGRTAW